MQQRWEEFGKLIKQARLGQGMTQLDLARKLNKRSASGVSRWEKGDRRPKQASLLALSNILGIRIHELQAKAGYTPEFDWYASFSAPRESAADILKAASETEKEELRKYLHYLRFRDEVRKVNRD